MTEKLFRELDRTISRTIDLPSKIKDLEKFSERINLAAQSLIKELESREVNIDNTVVNIIFKQNITEVIVSTSSDCKECLETIPFLYFTQPDKVYHKIVDIEKWPELNRKLILACQNLYKAGFNTNKIIDAIKDTIRKEEGGKQIIDFSRIQVSKNRNEWQKLLNKLVETSRELYEYGCNTTKILYAISESIKEANENS